MVERTVSPERKGRPSPSRFLLAGSAGRSMGAGLCTSGEFGFLTVTLGHEGQNKSELSPPGFPLQSQRLLAVQLGAGEDLPADRRNL